MRIDSSFLMEMQPILTSVHVETLSGPELSHGHKSIPSPTAQGPPLSTGDSSQDPHWKPDTAGGPEPYMYGFSPTPTPMITFYVRHTN